jgi:predicted alpha-1,6-mannanase (GH76 family)
MISETKPQHSRITIWCAFGLCIALVLLGVPVLRGEMLSEDDFYTNGLTSAKVLQQWYNDRGLWDSTGWWNAANCLEAIESVIAANNGEQYLDVIRSTFDRNSGGNFLNEFYDDEGWWALAWIRAFDLTGEPRYVAMAKTIFADMKGGWDEHCGGGIWWKKDRSYKNAIANELFLLVAIRLHQRTPGDVGPGSYFDWAQREWAWFKSSGMINTRNLVNDGLDQNCENNRHTTWTYNQGVLIGGLAELYQTTADTNCLLQAIALADSATTTLVDASGVLGEPNESRGLHGGDVAQFKGIFIRHLTELYDVTGNPAYREFLIRNARSVWRNDRDWANRFGGRWSGPIDAVDAARHSSAMRVITALAERPLIGTNFVGEGFLIWPAADLRHELGRLAGFHHWSANPIQDKASGWLVNGPATKALPPGDCDACFELKVDNFNRDHSIVARIAIVQVESQKTEAARELRRSDFANVLYQTFSLRFTAVTGRSYDFRTFWHHSPNAPRLTQRCVVVKPVSTSR